MAQKQNNGVLSSSWLPFCNDCLRDQPVYTHGNNYQNQGPISNVLAQIGNYGNFIAYLVMGIPAGMLISKYGYKKPPLSVLS